jgi:hypothetical protein
MTDLRNFQLTVRIVMTRRLRLRLWLGVLLIRAAARVLRCGLAVKRTEEGIVKPPWTPYTPEE